MEKYTFSKEIGSGSFGKVFLVESKQTGIQYVVKQVDLTKLTKKQTLSACKEVEVLSKLKHNNIVRYKESYDESKLLCIVMEYCEKGDLHKKIKDKRLTNSHLSEVEILDYFVQICLALEYIHEQRILHRDLKTKNIFLTKGNAVKLGDFGIAKVLENSFELAQTCIGSPFYISPEICENKPYNKKSDVWALGCVLYELATLKYAFIAGNMKSLLTKIITGIYNPLPTNLNIHIKFLISAMLKPDPKDRPTVSEVLTKTFLQDYKRKHTPCRTNLRPQRSKSVESSRSLSIMDKSIAGSSLELYGSNKLKTLTNPESKYKASVPANKSNFRGKSPTAKDQVVGKTTKVFYDDSSKKFNNILDNVSKYQNNDILANLQKANKSKSNWDVSRKLPKVDSQYYNLIAENQRKESEKQTKNMFLNKNDENKKINLCKVNLTAEEMNAPVSSSKINEATLPKETQEVEADGPENRKKWTANTIEKEDLIAILTEADLINTADSDGAHVTQIFVGNENRIVTVDDLLRLDTCELGVEVLQPVVVQPVHVDEGDWYPTLKSEVGRVKDQFDVSKKSYPISILTQLKENCGKLSSVDEISPRKTKTDSEYYNLELKRMELEKNVGLTSFLGAYRKMSSIFKNDLMSRIQSSRRMEVNGTETYIISDLRDSECHEWKEVMKILDAKQIYLPEIWELVVAENICYQQ